MVRIHSRLLEEDIICLEDGQIPPEPNGVVSYSRGELEALQKLSPEALKEVHRAKKHFGGTYVGPSPRSS